MSKYLKHHYNNLDTELLTAIIGRVYPDDKMLAKFHQQDGASIIINFLMEKYFDALNDPPKRKYTGEQLVNIWEHVKEHPEYMDIDIKEVEALLREMCTTQPAFIRQSPDSEIDYDLDMELLRRYYRERIV